MTTSEKRAIILDIATPTLIHLGDYRSLGLLTTGTDALIEDAWTRFFEIAWLNNQKVALDKPPDTA